ncbi:MAG TPA: 2-amino-4-hydroxy-6-hydroxymethyldihydropteridine diphosphokinase, partial [Chitinophagales bacterium]
REKNLSRAIELIAERVGTIIQQSFIYETAAWGKTNQPNFYNQAIEIETQLLPEKLLSAIKKIEIEMGRENVEKWSARIIDIDIIFYGNEIYESEILTIPHAFMQDRKFVLEPLNEIASNFVHPILKKTVGELLQQSTDDLPVMRINL